MRGSQTRVGIIDDHPTFRVGLRTALSRAPDIEVVWEAATHAEARRMMLSLPAGVVVVDVHLGAGEDGLEVAAMLRRSWPDSSVVLMTGLDVERAQQQAARLGAVDSIGKDAPIEEIIRRIRAASPAPRPGRRPSAGPGPSRASLTGREVEVLRLVAEGMRTRDIAISLRIAPSTVNNHVQSALRKLQARNRAHATRLLESSVTSGDLA